MQTHGGTTADTAILARERYFTARLLVDWGRDGTYSHPLADLSRYARPITLGGALKGSVPEELTLIDGAAAAELTATLAGEVDGLSLVEVFAPYNRRSPFYGLDVLGAEVRYSIDVHTPVATVNYPQFVGVVRSLAPDRGTGTVELEALDRVEMLRRPVRFPVWATSQYWTERGFIRAQLADSQAVIDHCLRQCDTSPTPYRPTYRPELNVPDAGFDGVHFWLSGSGSHFPAVGHMDNATAQTFPNTDGGGPEMYATGGDRHHALSDADPRPLCLAGIGNATGPTLKYWVHDRDVLQAGGTHFLAATLITEGSSYHRTADTTLLSVRTGSLREFTLRIRNGRLYSTLVHHGIGQTWTSTELPIPSNPARVRLMAIWDHSTVTGTRVAVGIDTTVSPWTTVAGPFDNAAPADDLKGLVTVNHRVSLQDIGYSTRNQYGSIWLPDQLQRPARFAAALDSGRNRFTYLPDKSGTDAWDVITEVAAAEFGSVFWDESGIFRFWNYDTILSKQATAVRTITTDDAASLGLRHSLDSVRNIWSVATTKKVGQYGIAYASQSVDEFYIPPGTRKTWRVFVGTVQSPDPFPLPKFTSWASGFPQWTDDVTGGYCAQYLVNGVWAENEFRNETSGRPRCWIDGNGYLVITAFNGWAEPMRYARNSGDTGAPALHIPGTVVAEADPLVISTRYQDSIDTYGGRNIELSGDWYQDGYQSSTMLASLAERTTKPIPVTETITIPGDPRLQLGDAVDIRDPNGLGARMRAQIFVRRSVFDDGLTDTLTVEILDPPGAAHWDGTDSSDRWDYGHWS